MNIPNETTITNAVARFGPWLAPIPTACLVAQKTGTHLDWHWSVAGIAGLAIEVVGIGAVNTALELRAYNASRHEEDPPAPERAAYAMTGLYVGSVVMLTLVLDVIPKAATLASLVFPLLSLAGAVTVAMRTDHKRREAENKRRATARKRRATQAERKRAEDARKAAEAIRAKAYRYCEPCDYTADTPQQWAGHCSSRAHKERSQ